MALKISILLNLLLLGGMVFLLKDQRRKNTGLMPALSEIKPAAQTVALPAPAPSPVIQPEPFRWSQLETSRNYQGYIANLRAIGCPEATIADIVRGDADRSFSWERNQLGLNGSGNGPWSKFQEAQLVASLLDGRPPTGTVASVQNGENQLSERSDDPKATEAANPAQSVADQAPETGSEVAQTTVPAKTNMSGPSAYPLFLLNVNWSALGFTPSQQAAIAQVRQQYLNQLAHPNPDPNTATGPSSDSPNQNSNPTAPDNPPANPNAPLRGLLGSQGWAAYQQLQYWYWYQPQVLAANAEGTPLCLDLNAFSPK